MNTISQGLWITVIGMSLVFLGIIALWGLMQVMVFMFTERKSTKKETAVDSDDFEQKKLAAAIAVACMIGMYNTSISYSPHKEKENISAWQAGHRSNQIYRNFTARPFNKSGKQS